jgi:hypothetical protein
MTLVLFRRPCAPPKRDAGFIPQEREYRRDGRAKSQSLFRVPTLLRTEVRAPGAVSFGRCAHFLGAAGFDLDALVALECNPFMTPKVFNINRRRFIKTTAAITAATGVPGWFLELEQAQAAQPKPLGPNDRPGIALVGCGPLPSVPLPHCAISLW